MICGQSCTRLHLAGSDFLKELSMIRVVKTAFDYVPEDAPINLNANEPDHAFRFRHLRRFQ